MPMPTSTTGGILYSWIKVTKHTKSQKQEPTLVPSPTMVGLDQGERNARGRR